MSTIVYNMDCMEGMKQYPDNYFDLAIVDPPYGAGFTESGGCMGWFTKYREDHQERGGGIPRTNFHGKKKYEHPQTRGKHEEGRQMGQAGMEQRQKNHIVGCAA